MKNNTLFVLCVAGILFRLIFGTLYGVLGITLASYLLFNTLFAISPLGPAELVLWLDGLPEGTQALVVSSLITVVGFLVAFLTATQNWKDQMQANLRLDAARDIDTTYVRATTLISDIEIYMRSHLELANKIREGSSPNDVAGGISFLQGALEKFQSNRAELQTLHTTGCAISGRYPTVLMATGDTWSMVIEANQAIASMLEKAWVFIPMLNLNDPQWASTYLQLVAHDRVQSLADECAKAQKKISFASGRAKGLLTSGLVEPNISLLRNFSRNGRAMLCLSDALKRGEHEKADIIVETIKP